MFVPVIDQAYYLAVRDYDGPDYDLDPDAPETFWVEPHRDVLYVRCMDEESDLGGVELVVSVDPEAPVDLEGFDEDWTIRIQGEWEVTGPVMVCTLEGWEIEELFDGPGRYGFSYLARKAEAPDPGEALEDHLLFVWPLDRQIVRTSD